MKNLILLLIFIIAGLSANAQNNQQKFYIRDSQSMVLILNNDIIGGINLLKSVPPQQIQILNIDPEKKLSSKENLFYNSNDKAGIMVAETDFDFKTKTQKELNEFFGLNSNNDLYLNGFLLENKKYRISSNSIAKIEVIESDNIFLDKPVLNITIK